MILYFEATETLGMTTVNLTSAEGNISLSMKGIPAFPNWETWPGRATGVGSWQKAGEDPGKNHPPFKTFKTKEAFPLLSSCLSNGDRSSADAGEHLTAQPLKTGGWGS